jgi:hypothetical protein
MPSIAHALIGGEIASDVVGRAGFDFFRPGAGAATGLLCDIGCGMTHHGAEEKSFGHWRKHREQ